jgi:hypothetical protein
MAAEAMQQHQNRCIRRPGLNTMKPGAAHDLNLQCGWQRQ